MTNGREKHAVPEFKPLSSLGADFQTAGSASTLIFVVLDLSGPVAALATPASLAPGSAVCFFVAPIVAVKALLGCVLVAVRGKAILSQH
jgi:hypothetical protein